MLQKTNNSATARSRRAWHVLVGAVLTTPLVLMAGPATADSSEPQVTSVADCPSSGSLCLYEGANFSGSQFAVRSNGSDGVCVSLVDHGWGERAQSAINTHRGHAAMFANDDCLGQPYPVPGNSSLDSFGSFVPKSVWVPAD
ncbi:peptidase inhibitor family I36 protein [Streptomyces sp. NBC_01231]|nr:peptidase inhibitor family I36 protein [Streptomyces sp. NBC_01231]